MPFNQLHILGSLTYKTGPPPKYPLKLWKFDFLPLNEDPMHIGSNYRGVCLRVRGASVEVRVRYASLCTVSSRRVDSRSIEFDLPLAADSA